MPRRVLDQHLALPQIRPQRQDFLRRTKRSLQQPVAVQLAQPLAIQQIALASTHILHLARIHQAHLQAPLFQHFKQRNPVHPRGLHGHALHLALLQPIRNGIEVCGEHAELAHALGTAFGRHRHPMTRRPHIYRRRIRIIGCQRTFRRDLDRTTSGFASAGFRGATFHDDSPSAVELPPRADRAGVHN